MDSRRLTNAKTARWKLPEHKHSHCTKGNRYFCPWQKSIEYLKMKWTRTWPARSDTNPRMFSRDALVLSTTSTSPRMTAMSLVVVECPAVGDHARPHKGIDLFRLIMGVLAWGMGRNVPGKGMGPGCHWRPRAGVMLTKRLWPWRETVWGHGNQCPRASLRASWSQDVVNK